MKLLTKRHWIININSFSDVKLQSRFLYRNIENSNEYVAVFANPEDPDNSQEFYVVKKFGLLKKRSFKKSMLSGVWSKYDEDGNVIAEYTFDEGDVLYKSFPQRAIKINDNADFIEIAKWPGDEFLYVVLDDVLLDKEIVIKDKPAISIEGFGKNDSKVTLYSNYDTPVRITFEGCDHVKLKNLHFSFNSEHEQPFILSFKNCNRVEIVDCSFYGDARYSLSFDANCDEIHLEDNRIDGFDSYLPGDSVIVTELEEDPDL